MPFSGVVCRTTRKSTGQVLSPNGAAARDRARAASARGDFLLDGIYELRVSLQGLQYRILYFFHGTIAAVVSHGLVKERVIPSKEIDRAIERKKRFIANPARHTHEES